MYYYRVSLVLNKLFCLNFFVSLTCSLHHSKFKTRTSSLPVFSATHVVYHPLHKDSNRQVHQFLHTETKEGVTEEMQLSWDTISNKEYMREVNNILGSRHYN